MNGMVATGFEGWAIGDIVSHVKGPSRLGTVIIVEMNKLSVMIQWHDLPDGDLDFQWSNKIYQS